MFITRETKLAIVKKHLEDGVTLKDLSEEYGIELEAKDATPKNLKTIDSIVEMVKSKLAKQ